MINNFKDLEKLVKLCRKVGITEIKVAGAELTLGPAPTTNKPTHKETYTNDSYTDLADIPVPKPTVISAQDKAEIEAQGNIDSDTLTEEQLLMWSAVDNTDEVPVTP